MDVRAVGVDPLAVALLDHLDAAVADVVGDPVPQFHVLDGVDLAIAPLGPDVSVGLVPVASDEGDGDLLKLYFDTV